MMDQCHPLKNLDDVLCWNEKDDWSKHVVPLSERSQFCYSGNDLKCCSKIKNPVRIVGSSTMKTLVCHDMKGGYLSDRFVNGTSTSDEYVFCHWPAIDIFVYFSHYFITIPPLMWINSAHKHGVKILGTIITEWTDGEQIWDAILSNTKTLKSFVQKLTSICSHYNFDGFLINIENKIDSSRLVNLIEFLKMLKNSLKPAVVIWYDSISLQNGKLSWQNELNEHNKIAFSICDGIYLNYGWKEENLNISASRAGFRQHDVYVGVDIFGRGCFGGGGYNSDKAVHAVRSHGLSVALFGVGWTYEVQTSKSETFMEVEQKFWSKLWPYLYIYGPSSLPFKTTFCPGYGKNLFNNGKLIKNTPWYNLSMQCHQPNLNVHLDDGENSKELQILVHENDGFIGGGCIYITNKLQSRVIYTLLVCDFVCEKIKPIVFSISSKWPSIYIPYKVILNVERHNSSSGNIILPITKPGTEYLSENTTQEDYSTLENCWSSLSHPLCDNDWYTNAFLLSFEGHIVNIMIETDTELLIGQVSLDYKLE